MARGVPHANRGAGLETAVEQANAQYGAMNIARVQKVAVPTKVLSDRKGGTKVIREKSTVDFIGVWNGRAIAFDAKENQKERFPLDSVHGHQVAFLDGWDLSGGIAFLLIYQVADQAVYVLPYGELARRWGAWADGGRASISADELRRLPKVRAGRGCAIDYLAALESWLKSQNGGQPHDPETAAGHC
jgi:recombination protein U